MPEVLTTDVVRPRAGPRPARAGLGMSDVAGYLLERGFLDARELVEGTLRIADVSRRNRVFLVDAGSRRSLVVKVAAVAGDLGVAREAAVLERLAAARPFATDRPALVGYDRVDGVLVLASPPGARDLRRHHARARFSCALARAAGRALAQVHALAPASHGLPPGPDPRSCLRLHRPDLDTVLTLSAAALELIRMVQASDVLCAALGDLDAGWSGESLVHGDVRWDNCLALPGSGTGRWTGLQLIDWELSGPGDPALDVGAFLGEYLAAWSHSVPIVDPGDPAHLLAHARLPLRRMRPAVRAFWDAYMRGRGLTPAASAAMQRRSTSFAAVRLLGAAFEEAQTLTELHAGVVRLIALSRNLLRRPRDGADLLGFGS